MKKISLSVINLFLFVTLSLAQSPGIQWQQTMGTKYGDDFYKVIRTSDGGILLVGDIAIDSLGNYDAWVVKKDVNGITQWEKTFGGSGDDEVYNVIQTTDGNFLIAGNNSSPEFPGHHVSDSSGYGGFNDAWVLKLSSSGSIIWQKLIGGKSEDYGEGLCEDASGNYFISGTTSSNDGDFLNKKRDSLGRNDAFIVKLSPGGSLLQAKCFGGGNSDELYSVLYNSGNIIAVGSTNSYDMDVSGLHILPADSLYNAFRPDIWYVRLDTNLNLIKQKCIGGTKYESGSSIKLLPNGSYGIAGTAGSQDGDVIGHYPDDSTTMYEFVYDGWFIEVDQDANIIRQKTIGGERYDEIYDFSVEPDGSVVLCGVTDSELLFPGVGSNDLAWVVKLNIANNIVWQYAFGGSDGNGGSGESYFNSLAPSSDGLGYYLAGSTSAADGDVTSHIGNYDGWLVKFGSVNRVTGRIFIDANSNNKYDAGGKTINNIKVQAQKGVDIRSNCGNGEGVYLVATDTGTYTIKPILNNTYYNINPVSKNVSHNSYFNTDTVDFILQPIANKKDIVVSLLPVTVARPGFDVSYKLTYFNRGTTTIASGKVKLKKDNKFNFISASPTNNTATGDTLIWNFTNLKPFDTTSITLNLKLATPPTANIGDTLRSIALLDPVSGDETPNDDTTTLVQVVQSSYDPNDKTELHGGRITSAQIAGTEYLTYLIRFQNTGTDTAFNIFVRDTLDSKLDWNSLEMLGSSHNYNLTIKDGNKLEWFFTNIKLVDSTTNEPASHGYIAYRIKPEPTLTEGDSVQNKASIYFDFNMPVNTNNNKTYLRNNIVTAVIDLNNPETQLYLYPNPASGMIVLKKEDKVKGNAILQIRDISGKLVKQINFGIVNTGSFKKQVDVSGLPGGNYLLQLNAGKKLYTGKLIIQ